MPWTPDQMESIRARAHGWRGPGAFHGVSQAKAKQMEGEGTRPPVNSQQSAIRKMLRKKVR